MRNTIIWIFAVVLTISAVIYQRFTGPTKPMRIKFEINGLEYKAKLARSLETLVSLDDIHQKGLFSDLEIYLDCTDSSQNNSLKAYIMYRLYPGRDTLRRIDASNTNGVFSFKIPSSPPAGKIEYYPVFEFQGDRIIPVKEGVVLRFKSPVAPSLLIPHIILMFAAMLFSNFAGIVSFFDQESAKRFSLLVIFSLGLGGLLFGPLVQNAAFGDYWTGWPFGADVTDTKTMVVFVLWLVAWLFNRKKRRSYLIVAASLIMLCVYTIPHSTLGSEFDYENNEVVTGN